MIDLITIGQERKEFIENLKKSDSNSENTNFIYQYNSPLKQFINTIWEEDFDNSPNNKLNKDFNDILVIKDQTDTSGIYSGTKTDKLFNVTDVGLNSFGRIKELESLPDQQVFHNLTKNQDVLKKPINFVIDLSSNNVFPYEINLGMNLLEDKTKYKIDILEGPEKYNDRNIVNGKINSNYLEFNLDRNIDSIYDCTVEARENYNIDSFKNLGNLYTLNLNRDILGSDYTIYYVDNELILKSGDGTSTVELISPEKL